MDIRYRLAVIDDYPAMRTGLAALLAPWPRGRTVLQAAHGEHYEQLLPHAGHIHLALVDLQMPVRNGFETIRWIRRHQKRTRTVAYSFLDTPESVHRALAAGADAFLAKDSTPEQWIRAVEDVLATGFHFNAYVTRALLRAIREGPPRTEPHHQWERLTEREREFLLTYTRKGMESLQQVARAMGVKRSTVETHRKAVARKCEAPKRADMVRLVLENGWGKGKK